MTLSNEKRKAFKIVVGRGTWFMRDPAIEVDGGKVPATSPAATTTYLGTKIIPWSGLLESHDEEILLELIRRVRNLPLNRLETVDLFSTSTSR